MALQFLTCCQLVKRNLLFGQRVNTDCYKRKCFLARKGNSLFAGVYVTCPQAGGLLHVMNIVPPLKMCHKHSKMPLKMARTV